jgi:3-dehydroquinate synthase
MKIIDSTLFKTRILIGNLMEGFNQYINNKNIVIIADANVMKYYPKLFIHYPVITVYSSEANKSIETVNYIYEKLLEFNADKSSFLLGVGGGVATDITGYVASNYMRGMKFGLMPTTLIGMADASIGGKNGLNFSGYKNIIGSINQPEIVLTDLRFLNTLSQKDIYSGFAEIIKTAIILDKDLFNYLNTNYKSLLKLDENHLEDIVEKTVKLKMSIVEKDEFDSGVRRILNFGHTFGHAIESEFGESLLISHGEAVAMGMILAMKLSVYEKILNYEVLEQASELIRKFNLPDSVNLDCKLLINKIKKDKKKDRNIISMILLEDFARPYTETFDLCELESKCNEISNL